jgi:hypothetical protein
MAALPQQGSGVIEADIAPRNGHIETDSDQCCACLRYEARGKYCNEDAQKRPWCDFVNASPREHFTSSGVVVSRAAENLQ